MVAFTPAQIALELGVTQKQVRDVLRKHYGRLPEETSRWELDESQAKTVRDYFEDSSERRSLEWALEPGDTVRRRAIHERYGGQQQGGISTPRAIPDLLIFTDPSSGARYGYDKFEGLREDGSYAYTGEGQRGDQKLERGNRAINESASKGKTIRLLRTNGVNVTYVGAFTTDDLPYEVEMIPDIDGDSRQGLIFNLVPVTARLDLLPEYGGEKLTQDGRAAAAPQVQSWSRPDYSDVVITRDENLPVADRKMSRLEFKLHSAFADWLTHQGTPPSRLRLPSGNTVLEPDFWVQDREWIVEAKKSVSRGHVRTAIGQVLDYVHVASRLGLRCEPVVLLPGEPEEDLVDLLQTHNIILVVRTEEGFEKLPCK
ncbi:hypothetical protein [Nesterenkonia muleiensis]|uniref:hypothetical protein n=1 Tax=Nesterenkonia muleiensis TaxID=2282648 RepID=UPI000E706FA9|nr:hypothetical protein [Nesterenkonia muleiensis]